jgi:hypothetical protein
MSSSSRLARVTSVNLISVFFDVRAAWLPSTMFRLPDLAARIIWSNVRSPVARNL